MRENNVITGIDIGCTAVRCVIALQNEDMEIEVAGIGTHKCTGHIRQGILVNAAIAENAILKAVEEAESICGLEVNSAFLSITGLHVRGILGSSALQIGDNQGSLSEEITEEDIEEVVEKAGNITLPSGCEVLERTVRDYSFGGFNHLPDPPVGLRALSIQARVYTVYADKTATENLRSVVRKAGIDIEGIIPSAVASGTALLNDDERKVGTVVVDIGSANTDIVIYQGGSPIHLSSFSMGGDRITADFQSFGISWENAEKLKRTKTAALNSMAEKGTIAVSRVGGRGTVSITLPVLTQLVSERVKEIFNFVLEEISASGVDTACLTGGIVITGGAARMPGIIQAAVEITGFEVEPGIPRAIKSDSKFVKYPEMATAIGLIKHGLELRKLNGESRNRNRKGYTDFVTTIKGFFRKLK